MADQAKGERKGCSPSVDFLVVILIIGILLGVALPNYMSSSRVRSIKSMVSGYYNWERPVVLDVGQTATVKVDLAAGLAPNSDEVSGTATISPLTGVEVRVADTDLVRVVPAPVKDQGMYEERTTSWHVDLKGLAVGKTELKLFQINYDPDAENRPTVTLLSTSPLRIEEPNALAALWRWATGHLQSFYGVLALIAGLVSLLAGWWAAIRKKTAEKAAEEAKARIADQKRKFIS